MQSNHQAPASLPQSLPQAELNHQQLMAACGNLLQARLGVTAAPAGNRIVIPGCPQYYNTLLNAQNAMAPRPENNMVNNMIPTTAPFIPQTSTTATFARPTEIHRRYSDVTGMEPRSATQLDTRKRSAVVTTAEGMIATAKNLKTEENADSIAAAGNSVPDLQTSTKRMSTYLVFNGGFVYNAKWDGFSNVLTGDTIFKATVQCVFHKIFQCPGRGYIKAQQNLHLFKEHNHPGNLEDAMLRARGHILAAHYKNEGEAIENELHGLLHGTNTVIIDGNNGSAVTIARMENDTATTTAKV